MNRGFYYTHNPTLTTTKKWCGGGAGMVVRVWCGRWCGRWFGRWCGGWCGGWCVRSSDGATDGAEPLRNPRGIPAEPPRNARTPCTNARNTTGRFFSLPAPVAKEKSTTARDETRQYRPNQASAGARQGPCSVGRPAVLRCPFVRTADSRQQTADSRQQTADSRRTCRQQ